MIAKFLIVFVNESKNISIKIAQLPREKCKSKKINPKSSTFLWIRENPAMIIDTAIGWCTSILGPRVKMHLSPTKLSLVSTFFSYLRINSKNIIKAKSPSYFLKVFVALQHEFTPYVTSASLVRLDLLL